MTRVGGSATSLLRHGRGPSPRLKECAGSTSLDQFGIPAPEPAVRPAGLHRRLGDAGLTKFVVRHVPPSLLGRRSRRGSPTPSSTCGPDPGPCGDHVAASPEIQRRRHPGEVIRGEDPVPGAVGDDNTEAGGNSLSVPRRPAHPAELARSRAHLRPRSSMRRTHLGSTHLWVQVNS